MSSNIPEDFSASVSNWKGTRTIQSTTAEILGEAQGIADGVIGVVNEALQKMEDSGNQSLLDAVEAIAALGRFSPTAINVSYSPPGITNPGYLMPGQLTLRNSAGSMVVPNTGTVTLPLSTPTSPVIGGTPPVAGFVEIGDVPALQTFYTPPIPQIGVLKVVGEPPAMTFQEFAASLPAPPPLRDLVLPVFTPQPFPDYVPPDLQGLPNPPNVGISLEGLKKYVRLFDAEIAPPNLGGVLVRDLVTERELRAAVETYRLRGCPLDEDVEMEQYRWADEQTRLINQSESRQLIIDEGLLGAEAGRLVLDYAVKYEAMMVELAITVARVYFDAESALVEAQLSMVKSMVLYYNALVAQYASDAELYELLIAEEVARLKYWEALVHGEIAKVKANAQMTQLYVQTEQVETIEADVYEAQVSALLAQVERYKAQIEAISAKAEVAKTSITVY